MLRVTFFLLQSHIQRMRGYRRLVDRKPFCSSDAIFNSVNRRQTKVNTIDPKVIFHGQPPEIEKAACSHPIHNKFSDTTSNGLNMCT